MFLLRNMKKLSLTYPHIFSPAVVIAQNLVAINILALTRAPDKKGYQR